MGGVPPPLPLPPPRRGGEWILEEEEEEEGGPRERGRGSREDVEVEVEAEMIEEVEEEEVAVLRLGAEDFPVRVETAEARSLRSFSSESCEIMEERFSVATGRVSAAAELAGAAVDKEEEEEEEEEEDLVMDVLGPPLGGLVLLDWSVSAKGRCSP